MSLACFECRRIGAFDTFVIADPSGKFDPEKPVSHFPNFCVCAGHVARIQTSETPTNFMIVVERNCQDSWMTGCDGCTLGETETRFVRETDLEQVVPNILAGLKRFFPGQG